MDFSRLFPIQEQAESGGNPNAVSPKGAKGLMQLMPGTQRDPGFGVVPAKDDSPAENRRVGQDYMKAMYAKYGDLDTALAAYNWGPGKVDEWIKAGADPAKLPAETRNYISKIKTAYGEDAPAPTVRQIDNAIERKPDAAQRSAALDAAIQAGIIRPTDMAEFSRRLEVQTEANVLREESRPNLLEQFGAALSGNTDQRLFRGITGSIWADEFPAVEGFAPDLAQLPKGAPSDLIEDYATAKSPEAAAKVLRVFNEEEERARTIMDSGGFTGIGLSLLSEFTSVSNIVPGMAVAKALQTAKRGSLALAQANRPFAAVGAAVTENLVSGTAVEAIAQIADGRYRPGDLALSLVADSLIGAASGGLAVRATTAEAALNRATNSVLERELSYAARAEKELGPNTTPDEMRRRMDSYPAEDAKKVITDAVAPSSNSKLLATEPTEAPAASRFDRIATVQEPGVPGSAVFKGNTDRVVVVNEAAMHPDVKAAAQAVRDMAHLLPDGVRIAVGETASATIRGEVVTAGSEVRIAISSIGSAGGRGVETAMHEVTHAITDFYLPNAAPQIRSALLSDFSKFLDKAKAGDAEAVLMRWADKYRSGKGKTELVNAKDPYEVDFGEWLAEQGTRYFREDAAKANTTGFSKGIVDKMTEWLASVYRWFTGAKEAGHLPPAQSFTDFMRAVAAKEIAHVDKPNATTAYSIRAPAADVANEVLTDPAAVRFGLSLAPLDTPKARADAQAMLALHKRAEQWAAANPIDPTRVDQLIANSALGGRFASTGLLMLKSPSPLVRMIASELLEDASGASGIRKPTAAISKHLTERLMLGNALNDVQSAYNFWKAANGGSHKDDLIGGTKWKQFNQAVASEIEARRFSGALTQDPNVRGAADVLEAAYQRIANEQRKAGTNGADALPTTSKGYMPHRMSPGAVLALSPAKRQVLQNALTDQFITIEGWDATFADRLAAKYVDRVRARGAGDYDTAIGGRGSASDVEEALRGMDLPEDVIANHMANFNKGSAGWTKARIELDLNRVYQTPEGEFRLMDIFETDQLSLLRSQAGRASGDVALTKFGVRGTEGLKLLRKAMQYGADGQMAGNAEREAFEQIAKEFMNEPFGNQTGRWADRLMTANAVVRLGGVVFNQFAELANGFGSIGVAASLKHIPEFRRLRAEVIELSKGNKVNNSLLDSIEAGGAEFGADNYKVVLPFDNQNNLNPAYGQDTLTVTDRLLRGAGHLQSKLSGWRAVHAVQERGMAEQIVLKIARYSQDGSSDAALRDMGITPELQRAIQSSGAARFDASGNPVEFDVTKIADPDQREAVIQAVWRGTRQIIQGTFIGERGKWAHDNLLKLMTQFRTFSLTATEKQVSRQYLIGGGGAAGAARLVGLFAGAASIAVPVYMVRTIAASIGREDEDEFLEQRLSSEAIGRAVFNYIGVAGLAGDFLDVGAGLAGAPITGGRAGSETNFVGNFIAPSLTLVDDAWKMAQGVLDPNDNTLEDVAKLLPGSRMPGALQLLNTMRD